MLAHEVPVEQRDGPSARLEQLHLENLRDRRFAGARQAGEEHREPLSVARLVAAPQLALHFREREPRRQLFSGGQAPSQVGRRDAERAGARRDLVLYDVRLLILHVHHLPGRHHADAKLLLMSAQEILRGIGLVERPACDIGLWTRVIGTDDEMRAAVVLPDDRVPEGFPRSGHPRGQRQERELHRMRRISV